MINLMIIPTNGFGIDGISSSIMNYYRKFDHNNLKVSLVVPKLICQEEKISKLEEEFIKNNDSVYRLNRKKILKYIISIINIIRKNNIDIIHVHGSSSLMVIELIAAFIAGVKIRVVHSHNTNCKYKVLNKIFKIPFNILTTNRLACGIEAGQWLFGKKEFIVLKNGVDIEKFNFNDKKRKELREKYKLNEDFVIGHVGGFNEQKNQKFLIDVFKELKKLNSKYKLICIGDGDTKPKIEDYISENKLEDIILLGNREDVPVLLNMMDIMVLPSLYEGLPMVVVEWQANGIPCFLSNNITKEVAFSNNIKFLDLNFGAIKWAQEINNSYLDRYNGNIYVKKAGYDINNNVNELINYYKKCLNKNKK